MHTDNSYRREKEMTKIVITDLIIATYFLKYL